jgi:hypothetical protein
MTPTTEAGQPRRPVWPLIVSIVAVILASFEISYSFGKFWVDRTQSIPFLDGFWFTMAITWAIRTYRKNASSRVCKWALAVVVPLVALTAFASFRVGKLEQYPEEAQKLVDTLRWNAREVKRIKAELYDARSKFTRPEELLTIQPEVSALKEHIEKAEQLMHRIAVYTVPAAIAQIMTLLGQALPIEKRQIENIENQIALVRSVQGLSANEKQIVYRQQLSPLIQQEEQIERERQEANLAGKLKNVRLAAFRGGWFI